MKDVVFYASTSGFVAGALVGSFVSIDLYTSIFLAGLGSAVAICVCRLSQRIGKNSLGVFVLCAASFSLFGTVRYVWFDSFTGDRKLEALVEKQVTVEGVIVAEPDRRERDVRYTVRAESLIPFPGASPEKLEPTKILVSTSLYPAYAYGDRISVSGKLRTPNNFKGDSGREFNYVAYLAKDKIFYTISFARIVHVSPHEGMWIKEKLFSLKKKFLVNIERVVSSPESELAGGIIVSGTQSVQGELKEVFRETGLIHIVALSGYNVTIVAGALMGLFGFLPRTMRFTCALVGVLLFAVVTGAGATIVRASLMASIVIIADALYRPHNATRSLMFVCALMVCVNPKIVAFDPSFQLSFLATLGLLFVTPLVKQWLTYIPEVFTLRDTVGTTLGAQLAVMPLLIYQTGTLSVVSLVVNVLVIPVIPFAMLGAFITGSLGFFHPLLSLPFAYATYALLHYVTVIATWFSDAWFASVTFNNVPLWSMVLLYLLIIVWVYRKTTSWPKFMKWLPEKSGETLR